VVTQSLNKGSDVVYDTWRKHPEWPRLHLVDFKHSERYFRAEHVCADCAYNSWPNRTGVRSLTPYLAHVVHLSHMPSELTIIFIL
jgi:hypothetical protein